MNILLICPPATMELPKFRTPYAFIQFFLCNLLKDYARRTVVGEHMGLEYLTASLEKSGFNVTLFDACLMQYPDWRHAADDLLKMKPQGYDLVGFTGSQDVFLENVHIARILRERGWKGHFIAGHDFCSLNHEELIRKFSVFDSIGRGEGDDLIVELAASLSEGGDLSEIEGLTYRKNGRIRINNPRALKADIDQFPFPDRRNRLWAKKAGLAMGIVSSRGCGYNKCTFCYPSVFSSANRSIPGGPWRARSAENVVEEMAVLMKEHQPEMITFVDENFLGCGEDGIERAFQIGEEILRRKLKLNYMFNCRSVDVNYDLLKLLKESGLYSLFIGFESGSQKILDYYEKGTTVSKQLKALSIIQSLDIGLVVGYIFFDPISTIDDLRQSLRFYLKLGQSDVSKYSQRLRVLPGTPIYSKMKRTNTVFGDIWETHYSFSSPQIDTVYALVNGLFHSLLPTLLEKTIQDQRLTERQTDRIISFMETDFIKALKMADDGLGKDNELVETTISQWSSEIKDYIRESASKNDVQ
jgi:anaerobic magnesium-protoporphyrin IX monomethyl ester cyclase